MEIYINQNIYSNYLIPAKLVALVVVVPYSSSRYNI